MFDESPWIVGIWVGWTTQVHSLSRYAYIYIAGTDLLAQLVVGCADSFSIWDARRSLCHLAPLLLSFSYRPRYRSGAPDRPRRLLSLPLVHMVSGPGIWTRRVRFATTVASFNLKALSSAVRPHLRPHLASALPLRAFDCTGKW